MIKMNKTKKLKALNKIKDEVEGISEYVLTLLKNKVKAEEIYPLGNINHELDFVSSHLQDFIVIIEGEDK